MIEHYPKHYGLRANRKALSRQERRADDRDMPPVERVVGKPRKKDRHRWCRGVIGREHVPEWGLWFVIWNGSAWYRQRCNVCGKVLKMERRPASGDC